MTRTPVFFLKQIGHLPSQKFFAVEKGVDLPPLLPIPLSHWSHPTAFCLDFFASVCPQSFPQTLSYVGVLHGPSFPLKLESVVEVLLFRSPRFDFWAAVPR